MSQRIGVYGGTFDPIHNAHVAMARTARDAARLDEVLFVVAARPPHKHGGPIADPEDRYALVEAALADEPALRPSRIEMDRPGPSYMVDTLRELARQRPGAELALIIGADSLTDLPKWKDFDEIIRRAHLLVVPRPGDWTPPPELADRFDLLPFPKTPLSSTDVRAALAQGDALDDMLPPAVLQLIRERGLYGTQR